jgi:hypothetical protein
VTTAAVLLLLMATGGLANAVVSLAAMPGTVDRFRSAAARIDASPSDIEGVVALIRTGAIATAALNLLIAVLLVALAFGNLGGRNPARITTWVVCGLGLICGCCSFIWVLAQQGIELGGSQSDPVAAELMRALVESYPSWWVGLTAALSVLQALGYLVVAVLLALPAANAFFRRRPPVQWQPPAPYASPPPPL